MSSGFLFEAVSMSANRSFVNEEVRNDQNFCLSPVTVSEVHVALKGIYNKKAARPNNLDPYLVNLSGDC